MRACRRVFVVRSHFIDSSCKMDLDNSTLTTPLLAKKSNFWKDQQIYSNGIQFESKVIVDHDEQNITIKRLPWKGLFPQIFASVIAFMLVTQPGINMVYSNIYISNYELTDVSKLSWLSGILVLCTPIGAITIGIIMDRIGRKNALLLISMPLLISWAIAALASPKNMGLIYASRVFAGIGAGMTSMVVVYVSEIAHAPYRQALLSLNSVFFSAGVLFATTVGSLFRWRAVNVIFFAFTAVSALLLVAFLPESPEWLTKFRAKRVSYDARGSLRRIHSKNHRMFAEEWDRLTYYERRPSAEVVRETPGSRESSCDGECVRFRRRRPWWWCRCRCWWPAQPPTVTRPVRVLAVVFLLQQLSGCYPVIFYAAPIFRSMIGAAGTDDGAPSQMDALIAMGAVRLLTSAVSCALSTRVGRRPLLIGSSLAMACSAALVAFTCPPAVAIRDDRAPPPPPSPLVPLAGVVAFVCSGSAGVLVFPWTLIGELLPVTARSMAGALLVSYAYVLMFAVLKAFPYAVTLSVGADDGGCSMAAVFAAFAVVSLATAAYAYVYLPETLGKQISEIEAYFADPPRPATGSAESEPEARS